MNVFKAILSGHKRYISKVTSISPFTGHHQTYTGTYERNYKSSIYIYIHHLYTLAERDPFPYKDVKKCI